MVENELTRDNRVSMSSLQTDNKKARQEAQELSDIVDRSIDNEFDVKGNVEEVSYHDDPSYEEQEYI